MTTADARRSITWRISELRRLVPARWAGPVTVAFTIVAIGRFIVFTQIQAPIDWGIYREAALRWLAGGPYFLPFQLAGPHPLVIGEVLYPPVILWLLVPFAHLPDVLWWLVPVGMTAGAIWWMRPTGWWLAGIACLAMTPAVQTPYLTGRPTMWIAAFLALGLIRGGWGALILLKPSLAPFALVGINRRWWWATLAALIALALPFGLSMWLDWLTAITMTTGGLLYSLGEVPVMLLPIVAWLGRTRDWPPTPVSAGGSTLAPTGLET